MAEMSMEIFHEVTNAWFLSALGSPTAVQQSAWPAIASGRNTLVAAPTGTGKTLSAFLVFIDRLAEQARQKTLADELQLIYISPLKSLAGDIRENLQRPLHGIYEKEKAMFPDTHLSPFDIKVSLRTGDTSQQDRRSMAKHPPHILITTPESLYLLLTSASGRKMLSTAKAVILDELHAVIDSKRGAHMMFSLARLDRLCKAPLQRIGLSATIEPLDKAASYLSPDPVITVAPPMHKEVRLFVQSPRKQSFSSYQDTIWNAMARSVYEQCINARSVIVFVEGRTFAEKIAYAINLLGGEGFARTHHGSLSKEQRLAAEEALRNGSLKVLCATSSMELGIDVGDIDLVIQIGCPRTISSTMQRLGRAGHNPGRVSTMQIYPRSPLDALYCGLTARVAANGGIEHVKSPRLCLDVLAQHLVSMASEEKYTVDEVLELTKRAYPFQDITASDVEQVLEMLAGDYEHDKNIPVRPRLLYDRIHGIIEGDNYSRMLAVSAGGTIPDKGLFAVRTENGVKLGEVDEEFVFEARIGDKFLLGTYPWKIQKIDKDIVMVAPTSMVGATPPFYKAEISGRRLQTGLAFGSILRELNQAMQEERLMEELLKLGMDEGTAKEVQDLLQRQKRITGELPSKDVILVEHYKDAAGCHQTMFHSLYGRRVNEPLAILAREAAGKAIHNNISTYENDDGFLLLPYGDEAIPTDILRKLKTENSKEILEAALPATPLFSMTFRYNAARALMMGVRKKGRVPLWIQRLRSTQMMDMVIHAPNHPIIRETKRECMEDYWDIEGTCQIIEKIKNGEITILEQTVTESSPMSLQLRYQMEGAELYNYSPSTRKVQAFVEEALNQAEMLSPSRELLQIAAMRKKEPEDEKQLHSLLMMEGDIVAGEVAVPIEWLEGLIEKEQAEYIEPGLWIAAEHKELYSKALTEKNKEAFSQILIRNLRYRGEADALSLATRYLWRQDEVAVVLKELTARKEIIEADGSFYHAGLYERAREETIKRRRMEIMTLPSAGYAAFRAERTAVTKTQKEQLKKAICNLLHQPYPAEWWETIIFPARVNRYREGVLDEILGEGEFCCRMSEKGLVEFYAYDEIDWEKRNDSKLDIAEQAVVYSFLETRGASFMQRIVSSYPELQIYDILLQLLESGLICADSFLPVRLWLLRDVMQKAPVKKRAMVKSKAMMSGRWEICHSRKDRSVKDLLIENFKKTGIVCRETVFGLSWAQAMELLRVMEYTGEVRRGYFFEGMSGIQFLLEKDYALLQEWKQKKNTIHWLSAVDPDQCYGNCLPHEEQKSFMLVPGTAVACLDGEIAAIFERKGNILRTFADNQLVLVMQQFVQDFFDQRIYAGQARVVVKKYPKDCTAALEAAGFMKEMQDYVLYRR